MGSFTVGSFWIINEFDRPYERSVVEVTHEDGRCQYVHATLRDFPGMRIEAKSTRIEDFGFVVKERKNGRRDFIKMNPSAAEYHDGKIRDWQGSVQFSLVCWGEK
jgi:hypothetical protein